MRFAALLLGISLACAGCAQVTEGDRLLMEQVHHIGNYMTINSTSPEMKQAGKDTADNAMILMKHLGVPKKPAKRYTPQLSAQYRKQAVDEHAAESGILGLLKGIASSAGFPWITTILALGGGLLTMVRKRLTDKKLVAVYAGVQNIIKDAKDGDVHEAVIETMRTTASAHGVFKEIHSDLVNLISKGILKSS